MERVSQRPGLIESFVSLVAPKEVAEFWLGRINPMWSLDRPLARVIARDRVADGAVSLTLRPNRHFDGYRPGQHSNVGIEIDGVLYTRSYSFADAPRRNGTLRLVVRETEGGRVSSFLQTVAVGTIVQLSQAFGDFEIQDGVERPVVLLAAGSGITPMLSLLKEQAEKGFPRRLHLVYWARRDEEMIDRDALLALRSPNCKITLISTSLQGRICASQIDDVLGDSPDVLACGPSGFVESARALTSQKCQISFQAESFTPPQRMDLNVAEGSVNVTLTRSGKLLRVSRAKSLLEGLEELGVKPAHGCRMGICNTCACTKTDGTAVNLLDGNVLREASQPIRICIHAAQSDITLDL